VARVPLTNELVAPARMVLDFEKVGLTAEQFSQLCCDNPNLRMELTARKELIIMSPTGLKSAWRENILSTRLTIWAEQDGTGIVCSPSALYKLPNGAFRGSDAAWIRRERLAPLTDEELEKFGSFCPDFVAEIMSPSDRLAELQEKMEEYVANGAQLGWLIDPFETRVYVYRPAQPVECLQNPSTISGDPLLPAFTFNVAEIW
jgi:Uma2 family endonuclease